MRSFIYKSLRGSFSSVGYHLRGCSRVEYLSRIVKGTWSQKSKMVDWNHNPIVLLKSLVWKPYSFTLYAIVFILFYYILAYICLLHSHRLICKKRLSPYSPPSRVITIGWISLIFLIIYMQCIFVV